MSEMKRIKIVVEGERVPTGMLLMPCAMKFTGERIPITDMHSLNDLRDVIGWAEDPRREDNGDITVLVPAELDDDRYWEWSMFCNELVLEKEFPEDEESTAMVVASCLFRGLSRVPIAAYPIGPWTVNETREDA